MIDISLLTNIPQMKIKSVLPWFTFKRMASTGRSIEAEPGNQAYSHGTPVVGDWSIIGGGFQVVVRPAGSSDTG